MSKEIFRNIGQCIYCGSTAPPLSEEHILPYFLNGNWILENASCSNCATITSKFELNVARYLIPLTRAYLNLRTRTGHPSTFPVTVIQGGVKKQMSFPITEIGAVTCFPVFSIPGYFINGYKKTGIDIVGLSTNAIGLNIEELKKKYNIEELQFSPRYKPVDFARMLAKIAYGFAIGKNITFSEVFVLGSILGTTKNIGCYVGASTIELAHNEVIGMRIEDGVVYAAVKILSHLAGAPTYSVVLGKTE